MNQELIQRNLNKINEMITRFQADKTFLDTPVGRAGIGEQRGRRDAWEDYQFGRELQLTRMNQLIDKHRDLIDKYRQTDPALQDEVAFRQALLVRDGVPDELVRSLYRLNYATYYLEAAGDIEAEKAKA